MGEQNKITEIEITDVAKNNQKNTYSIDVDFRDGNVLVNITFYKTDIEILEEIVKELRR